MEENYKKFNIKEFARDGMDSNYVVQYRLL
jgi:hypothetical protein